MTTTRLSSLQYPMLRMFAEDHPDKYMSIEEAGCWDQRPFRSMLYRGWIKFHPRRGFRITREGRDAWSEFQHHNIARKNPSLPLTSYFDPDAYGLRSKPKPDRASAPAHQGAAA